MNLSRLKNVSLTLLISVSLAVLTPAASASGETAPVSGLDIQLIADQTSAVPSGLITYHILYHNAANRSMNHASVKVNVAGKASVEDSGGGSWDANAKQLQWQLPNISAGDAGVISFSLKANSDLAVGDAIDLAAEASADLSVTVRTRKVLVSIGTDIHQPAFNGYPDGGFHPQGNLTRAETAAIVSRLEQLKGMGSASYTDVPATHWAYTYIEKVTKAGWMQGNGGALFTPEVPITRAELAVILLRIRGIQAVPLSGFADTLSNWAANSVGTAKALGYINGDVNGKFNGDSSITREDAAKLLVISLSRGQLTDGQEKVIQHWPDVQVSSWSFGWVEELSLVAHESSSQGALKEALVRYLPDQTQTF